MVEELEGIDSLGTVWIQRKSLGGRKKTSQ